MSVSDANTNFRAISTSTDRPQVLNVGQVNSGLLSSNNLTQLGAVVKQYVGYSSTNLVGAPADGKYVMTAPGLAASVTASILALPVGSMVLSARVEGSSDLAGGTTYNLRFNSNGVHDSGGLAVLQAALAATLALPLGAYNNVAAAAGVTVAATTGDGKLVLSSLAGTVTAGSAVVYISALVPADSA